MTHRGPRVVVANWKMNLVGDEAKRWVETVRSKWTGERAVTIAVAPSFVQIASVAKLAAGCGFLVTGQDCHEHIEGAHTGAVSARQLKDAGADAVILGHSERRREFGETDDLITAKLGAARSLGLLPILCVGETLAERDAGEMKAVLERQLRSAFVMRSAELVVAYEPVWAIGTGRTASVAQVSEAIDFVLAVIGPVVPGVLVLYGGSVNRENAASLFALPAVGGGLIGGASLDPLHFLEIADAAAENHAV